MNNLYLLELCERAHYKHPPCNAFWYDSEEVQFIIEGNVVAFAGTNQLLLDWMRNFDATLVPNDQGPGLVHQGFKRMSEDAWPALIAQLNQGSDWVFTGHSQGGAVASLCAYRFKQLGCSVSEVTLFGSPKFADQDFVDSWDINHYRYVNSWDYAPLVPFGRYRHLPNERRIGKQGISAFFEFLTSFTSIHRFPAYKNALLLDKLLVS